MLRIDVGTGVGGTFTQIADSGTPIQAILADIRGAASDFGGPVDGWPTSFSLPATQDNASFYDGPHGAMVNSLIRADGAAVPLPGTLPLALVGLGVPSAAWRRKTAPVRIAATR